MSRGVAALALLALAATSSQSAAQTSPSPAAECPPPREVVDKLQARYDTTRAFRANFTQRTTVGAMGQADEARGTVVFKKPGKMRWDYSEPEEQLIISDADTLWVYQPEEKQVLKGPFKAAFVSSTPVSFLAGVGRIDDDFKVSADPRGCVGDRIYVKLVPKDAADVGHLVLVVDRATYDIVEAAVTDPIGNVTSLTFADMERNVEIPESSFKFEVPAGVDVITAPGAQ